MRLDGVHLAYPDIGYTLFPLEPLLTLFSIGSGNAHKGFLDHAPEDFSHLGTHRQHRLDEKTTGEEVACSLVWCSCGCINAAKVTSGSSSKRYKAFVSFCKLWGRIRLSKRGSVSAGMV
jgi:hypothetical protein